jgi:pimeloyl-ACP methyl ester carboxylesterase
LQHELRDPRYDEVQSRLSRSTRIDVPTLMIQGGADSCAAPSESEGMDKFFTADYERIVVKSAGHFPHREAMSTVAEAIVRWLKTYDRKVL